MLKRFLLILFVSICGPSMSAQVRFVEDGKICEIIFSKTGFITNSRKHCRPPNDPQEIQNVLQENREESARKAAKNQFDSCQFSIFRGWSAEISRLKKSIESERFMVEYTNKEIYWANQDIQKAPYLPSDTIREAQENLNANQEMANDSRSKISKYQWCVKCAMKSPKDYHDCAE